MGEFASNLGISKGGGKRYTVSTSAGSSGLTPGGRGIASIEKINRTGLPEDVLKRLRAKRPVVDDSGEADFRFGKPSKFQLTDPSENAPKNPGFETHWPDKEQPEEEPPSGVIVLQYDEVARSEETIRVENPDDPAQYVMVKRALAVLFVGRDDGIYRAFNFKYDD